MNGTVSLGERISAGIENALAWVVESGVLGAIPVLAILAALLGLWK